MSVQEQEKIEALYGTDLQCPYRQNWKCKINFPHSGITFEEVLKICNNCLLANIGYSIFKNDQRYTP